MKKHLHPQGHRLFGDFDLTQFCLYFSYFQYLLHDLEATCRPGPYENRSGVCIRSTYFEIDTGPLKALKHEPVALFP